MRTIIIIVITLFFTSSVFAQEAKVQQWKIIVSKGKKDTATLFVIDSLCSWYGSQRTDTGIYYLAQMKSLAEYLNNKLYIIKALRLSAEGHFTKGKTTEALKEQYRALDLAEELGDSASIAIAYVSIGNSHKEYGDYAKALYYFKKSYQKAIECKNELSIELASLNLGYAYAQLNQLDSALYYEQQAYSLDLKRNKGSLMPGIECYLANIQFKYGNYTIAKAYYQSAINKLMRFKDITYGHRPTVWAYLGLANCSKYLNNEDSAMYYAKNAITVAEKLSYLKGLKEGYQILAELFEKRKDLPNAFQYQKLYISANDSLYSRDKSSAIESLTFEQELKENERQAEVRKQKEERSHNIQLAITAIVILTFLILFLLLSRSILVSHRVVAFLNVIVLLVVFEFINLLMHPFLERITNHSPVLMLLALVAIAALIVPLHHKLEHWTTKKLVEKNKAIRLANAKKTIEELEERNTDNTNPTTTS